MKIHSGLILLLLFTLQTAVVFLLFEHLNSNVIIPYILLIGLGTWLRGRRTGLILILLSLVPSYLCFQLHADEYAYPIDRLAGALTMLIAVGIISRLRDNTEGIRQLNRQLENMVSDRDRELSWLTDELLHYSENRRAEIGQRLHDGIGQQLTGIQLLSSSLEEHLRTSGAPEYASAEALAENAAQVHHQIRGIARSLFPVRIAHVGLRAALDEMISCLGSLHSRPITLQERRGFRNLPEPLALQLYRICQESCTYLLEHENAAAIHITLNTNQTHYILGIEHNGGPAEPAGRSIFSLIQYRIRKVHGDIRFCSSPRTGHPVFYFQVPKPVGGFTL